MAAYLEQSKSARALYSRSFLPLSPFLFFLSFLPQFVVATHGQVPMQMAGLGLTFTLQAAVLFSLLGYFSGAVGQWLTKQPKASVILDRVAGTIFVGLGLRLLISA